MTIWEFGLLIGLACVALAVVGYAVDIAEKILHAL